MVTSGSSSAPTVIDLFAGCGGLSLGLEQAGFQTIAFSELNEHAAATYLDNRLNENVRRFGDVHTLLDDTVVRRLKREALPRGVRDVSLVAGGPPCQGFSAIGHRRTHAVSKEALPSNHLYVQMIDVIRLVKPRMFLFENVRGIMTGRWTEDGTKGEIWSDVLAAFREIPGYDVDFDLIHAKDYGVPQNRPRVLLVGIRRDLGWTPSLDIGATAGGLLPSGSRRAPDPIDFLGDLEDPEILHLLRAGRTRAAGALVTKEYPAPARTAFQREMRQLRCATAVARQGHTVSQHEYSRHSQQIIEKFEQMILVRGKLAADSKYRTKKFAQRVIPERWDPNVGPNITATSLPDDFVHYRQPRVLTVREWARLQTFPDWYDFLGPRTTGGSRRAGNPTTGDFSRELPRYTQIGNAVPVRLARAIGEHFIELLRG